MKSSLTDWVRLLFSSLIPPFFIGVLGQLCLRMQHRILIEQLCHHHKSGTSLRLPYLYEQVERVKILSSPLTSTS